MVFKSIQEVAQVATRKLPSEGPSDLFVVALEAQDAVLELVGGSEVVRGEHLPLEHRVVDLDLVEPTGMHGRVHEHEVTHRSGLDPCVACLHACTRRKG